MGDKTITKRTVSPEYALRIPAQIPLQRVVFYFTKFTLLRTIESLKNAYKWTWEVVWPELNSDVTTAGAQGETVFETVVPIPAPAPEIMPSIQEITQPVGVGQEKECNNNRVPEQVIQQAEHIIAELKFLPTFLATKRAREISDKAIDNLRSRGASVVSPMSGKPPSSYIEVPLHLDEFQRPFVEVTLGPQGPSMKRKMLLDTGSSVNTLTAETFRRLTSLGNSYRTSQGLELYAHDGGKIATDFTAFVPVGIAGQVQNLPFCITKHPNASEILGASLMKGKLLKFEPNSAASLLIQRPHYVCDIAAARQGKRPILIDLYLDEEEQPDIPAGQTRTIAVSVPFQVRDAALYVWIDHNDRFLYATPIDSAIKLNYGKGKLKMHNYTPVSITVEFNWRVASGVLVSKDRFDELKMLQKKANELTKVARAEARAEEVPLVAPERFVEIPPVEGTLEQENAAPDSTVSTIPAEENGLGSANPKPDEPAVVPAGSLEDDKRAEDKPLERHSQAAESAAEDTVFQESLIEEKKEETKETERVTEKRQEEDILVNHPGQGEGQESDSSRQEVQLPGPEVAAEPTQVVRVEAVPAADVDGTGDIDKPESEEPISDEPEPINPIVRFHKIVEKVRQIPPKVKSTKVGEPEDSLTGAAASGTTGGDSNPSRARKGGKGAKMPLSAPNSDLIGNRRSTRSRAPAGYFADLHKGGKQLAARRLAAKPVELVTKKKSQRLQDVLKEDAVDPGEIGKIRGPNPGLARLVQYNCYCKIPLGATVVVRANKYGKTRIPQFAAINARLEEYDPASLLTASDIIDYKLYRVVAENESEFMIGLQDIEENDRYILDEHGWINSEYLREGDTVVHMVPKPVCTTHEVQYHNPQLLVLGFCAIAIPSPDKSCYSLENESIVHFSGNPAIVFYDRTRPAICEVKIHLNAQTTSDLRRMASTISGVIMYAQSKRLKEIEVIHPKLGVSYVLKRFICGLAKVMEDTKTTAALRYTYDAEMERITRPIIPNCECAYCSLACIPDREIRQTIPQFVQEIWRPANHWENTPVREREILELITTTVYARRETNRRKGNKRSRYTGRR